MISFSFLYLLLSLFSLLNGAFKPPVFGYIGSCPVRAKISQTVHDIGSNCRQRLIDSAYGVLDSFGLLQRLNDECPYPTTRAFKNVKEKFRLDNGVSCRLDEYHCELTHNGMFMTCYLRVFFAKIRPNNTMLFQMKLKVTYLNDCAHHIIRNGQCVPPYCTEYDFKPYTSYISLKPLVF